MIIQTTKAKPRHEESALQKDCVKWARYQYPVLQKLLFSIPNGGKRVQKKNASGKWYSPEAGIMKAEGLVAGVYDLFLAVPIEECHGVFIEMKSKTGSLSPEQKEFRAAVEMAGYKCVTFKTLDSFMDFVNSHMDKSPFKHKSF